jgi:hypothetical protein
VKGLSDKQLGEIDVELKEAVCDALVNALVGRVSGSDERGRAILGSSPRRGLFAGQLLPVLTSAASQTKPPTSGSRLSALI